MIGDWRSALSALEQSLKEDEVLAVGYVVERLVTSLQLAEKYGFAKETAIHNLKVRNKTFPKPIKRFGRTDVFWLPDVEDWMESHGRRHDV